MPADRLDDLDARVRDLETELDRLGDEFDTVRTVVRAALPETDEAATEEDAEREAATIDGLLEPPSGASQTAVDDAVRAAEESEDRTDSDERLVA